MLAQTKHITFISYYQEEEKNKQKSVKVQKCYNFFYHKQCNTSPKSFANNTYIIWTLPQR